MTHTFSYRYCFVINRRAKGNVFDTKHQERISLFSLFYNKNRQQSVVPALMLVTWKLAVTVRNYKLNYCCVMRICHLIAFAGGMVAGGALALLFAPKKGEDIRKDIKEKLREMKMRVDEAACCMNNGHCTEEKVDVVIEK